MTKVFKMSPPLAWAFGQNVFHVNLVQDFWRQTFQGMYVKFDKESQRKLSSNILSSENVRVLRGMSVLAQ